MWFGDKAHFQRLFANSSGSQGDPLNGDAYSRELQQQVDAFRDKAAETQRALDELHLSTQPTATAPAVGSLVFYRRERGHKLDSIWDGPAMVTNIDERQQKATIQPVSGRPPLTRHVGDLKEYKGGRSDPFQVSAQLHGESVPENIVGVDIADSNVNSIWEVQ